MEYTRSLWRNAYERLDFFFEGRDAVLVLAPQERRTGRWLLKTEYFEAFQDLEEALVSAGFCLAFLRNESRWGPETDFSAKLRFRNFLVREFGLCEKCVPIGMSCGGLLAVKLTARHPEMIEALYLDAPVINLLSCPMGMGEGTDLDLAAQQEMLGALGLDRAALIAYRDHPLDNIPALLRNRIPLVLVWGDCDTTVPFCENGAHVLRAYQQTDIPMLAIKKENCGHHPHGPEDCAPAVRFLMDLK